VEAFGARPSESFTRKPRFKAKKLDMHDRPSNPAHDGKGHKIRVTLIAPKGRPTLRVYARTGYFASPE
jgi:hypothetical protein